MNKTWHLNLAKILAAACFASSVGCAARYHTVHKPEGAEASNKDNASDATPVQGDPTAGLETIVDGQIVTSVPLGQEVILRPTEDTLDPDNVLDADCRNPGITSAAFLVENAPEVKIERSGDCIPLETKHVFTAPGAYIIALEVLSDENEKASAASTIVVYDPQVDTLPPGGFVISAEPLHTNPNKEIKFNSSCRTNENTTISWDFGDGNTAVGATASHAYSTVGQYRVTAQCDSDNHDSLFSELTISITPESQSSSTSMDSLADNPSTSDTEGDKSPSGSDADSNKAPGDGSGTNDQSEDPSNPGSNAEVPTNTDTDSPTGTDTDSGGYDNDDDEDSDGTTPGQHPGQSPAQSPYQGIP